MDSPTVETKSESQSSPSENQATSPVTKTSVYDYPSSIVSHKASSPAVINDDQVHHVVVETEHLSKESDTHVQEREDENADQEGREKGEQKESEKALLEDTIKIDIDQTDGLPVGDEGEDTPTLPLPNKNKQNDKKHKERPSMFLFPITRLKLAWTSSSGVVDFLVRATCIIFTSLGWLFCVGGFPFISLVMLIIGGIFIDDCPVKPEIPIYLVVAGVFGTLQHLFAVWTKYVPRDTESPGSKYRGWCITIDFILQIFLGIWFILGCVWVYGIYEPEYVKSDYPGEYQRYCHKTVYLFTFWILNISFIALAILFTFAFCCILFISTSPKEVTIQE